MRPVPPAVFLPAETEPAIDIPPGWPYDKHLALQFLAPVLPAITDDEDETEDWT